jgi:glutamate/tyrosine decarboxylase-like PLP-dependent enzyme
MRRCVAALRALGRADASYMGVGVSRGGAAMLNACLLGLGQVRRADEEAVPVFRIRGPGHIQRAGE